MNLESALAKLHAEFFGPDDCHARDHLFERGFYLDADIGGKAENIGLFETLNAARNDSSFSRPKTAEALLFWPRLVVRDYP